MAAENEPADDHQTDTDTIQHWRKHCSKVAVNLAFFNPEPIGGQGAIVEIDESKSIPRQVVLHHGQHSVVSSQTTSGKQAEYQEETRRKYFQKVIKSRNVVFHFQQTLTWTSRPSIFIVMHLPDYFIC